MLSSLIPIKWTIFFFVPKYLPLAKRKSRDRIIEIETQSCRPTNKKEYSYSGRRIDIMI